MTPQHRQRLQYDRVAAQRRIQIARMVEALEQLQRTPARDEEQFELRKIAIDDLLDQADLR